MEVWRYRVNQSLLGEIEDYIDEQLVRRGVASKLLASRKFIFYHLAKELEDDHTEEVSLCLNYYEERLICAGSSVSARGFISELEGIVGERFKVDEIKRSKINVGPINEIK